MPGQYSCWGNHQRTPPYSEEYTQRSILHTPPYSSQTWSLVLCFMASPPCSSEVASPMCPTPAGQVPPPPEEGGVPRGQHEGKMWAEPGTFPWGC